MWTWAWLAWLSLFLVIELPAAMNKTPGDTLSEHIWKFIGKDEDLTGWVRLRRMAFLAFAAILVVHLFTAWI